MKTKPPFPPWPRLPAVAITWATSRKSLELGSPHVGLRGVQEQVCSPPTPLIGLINKLGFFQLLAVAPVGLGSAGGGQTVLL